MFDYGLYIYSAYGVWFLLGFGFSYYIWRCWRRVESRLLSSQEDRHGQEKR